MSPVNLGEQFGFGNIGSLGEALGYLIIPAFSIAGVAVILYFLIGAFKFISAGGDKTAVESARGMITHAIIGFVLLMLMFLIIEFIPEFFGFSGFQIIQ